MSTTVRSRVSPGTPAGLTDRSTWCRTRRQLWCHDQLDNEGTIWLMQKRWDAAPGPVRRVVVLSLVLFIPLFAGQFVGMSGILRSISEVMSSGDPFALLENASERPAVVRFATGFSMSMAATLGALTLLGGARLLTPYRNGSLRLAQYGFAGQVLIITSNLVGVALGNRPIDATTIGTVLSLLYTTPVIVAASHKVVRAWSVPFSPPPPPLP
jgi:hypothetical protein